MTKISTKIKAKSKSKEGKIGRCTICGDKLEDKFWRIERYEKQINSFPCPKCGTEIIIEYYMERDGWELTKPCSCPVTLTSEVMEESPPRWKRSAYSYCDECFKELHGSILFERLGDD